MMAKIDVALSINDIRESCPWLRSGMNMLVGGAREENGCPISFPGSLSSFLRMRTGETVGH